nr:MAG TPA: hypothetical protein [Caudoviricetes sp.]
MRYSYKRKINRQKEREFLRPFFLYGMYFIPHCEIA